MSLDSVAAKLSRASEQILAVDAALSGADPLARHCIAISRGVGSSANVIDVTERLPQDPARVAILVGEVLQHLRSALDHLIGELERKNGLDRSSDFEFPIFWDKARYAKNSPRKIKGVSSAVAAVIERNQPYHRPAPSYKDHPLWILHDLNNADKHRVLIGTGSSLTVDNFDVGIAPGSAREIVLAVSPRFRATLTSVPETADGERWTLNASFTKFGQRYDQPIIPGLQQLRDAVAQIIDDCRRA